MTSADDYNRMIGDGKPGSLVAEMDRAIAEENARFQQRMNDPAYLAEDKKDTERWASIGLAEKTLGEHGVVLPMATALKVLAALRGEDTGYFTTDLLAGMVQDRIKKQVP